MARISLRAYNRDIEVMIDKGQVEEAFAHCRYILELYPKHIDTYRLMGKDLLEAQRFSDASDVFHRVLSSVPDDFIAHLGMSIIREDESNLDAAIWHMERSFEVQPSNAAVQVELRRLYGLRDGVTPQKIQLTRGALARMSAKSNLYTQAIAELRTALSNDPQRPDLQVVLADMYMHTGARMEAIETCNSLISKLPYCLVANRILAELLPETERSNQAQEYRSRLGELNPYYLQLSPVAPTLEQVPDGAVTIERFKYSDEPPVESKQAQPAWAASLGVDLDEDETMPDGPEPDWLQEISSEEDVQPSSDLGADAALFDQVEPQESDVLPTEPEESEQIPDWMSSEDEDSSIDHPGFAAGAAVLAAGALLSEQEEGETESEIEPAVDPAHAEDGEPIPNWMSTEDAAEDQDSSTGQPELAAGASLSEQEEGETDSEIEPAVDPAHADDGEPIPDWMAESDRAEGEQITENAAEQDDISPTSEVVVSAEIESDLPAEEADQLPDWMSAGEQQVEGDTPDWLRDAMDETSQEEELIPDAEKLTAAAAILSDEASISPISAEEKAVDGDFSTELDLEAEAVETSEALHEEIENELPTTEGAASTGAALTGAALAGAALGAVLGDEDAQQSDLEDEADIPAEDSWVPEPSEDDVYLESDQEIPDWLQDLGEDLPADADPIKPSAVFDDQPAEEEHTPIPIIDTGIEDSETDDQVEPHAEVPGVTVELIPAAELDEELIESEFPESIPDWLSKVSPKEMPEQLVDSDEYQDIVKAEIPVWLRKMEEQHKADLEAAGEIESLEELELDTDFTDLSGEDVPSWLMSAMETELPEEVPELTEVKDISEIIHEPGEPADAEAPTFEEPYPQEMEAEVLDAIKPLAEEIETEQIQEEIVPPGVEVDGLAEVDESLDGEIQELFEAAELIPELESEAQAEIEEFPEEILPDEEEPDISPEEDDGISIPGLVAAGAVAAHVLEDDDTQPVAITEELDTTEIEAVEFEVLGLEEEVLELSESVEEVVPDLDEELEGELSLTGEIQKGEELPTFADTPLSGEEEDAAMAWLESLAAKQGAAEEELITPAEDRLEKPPEWVQEESASELKAFEEIEIDDQKAALTAAVLAGAATAALTCEDQPTEEDESPEMPEPEPDEELSEWIPEITAEAETAQETLEPEDHTIADVEPEIEPLEIEEEPDVIAELAAAAEVDLDEVEEEQTSEEIPGWLSDLAGDQEIAAEPQSTDWTPDMLAEDVVEPEAQLETFLDEKLDLNAASLVQLEKIPGIGFIHAQNIVNYRAASGPYSDLEQLEEVDGLTADIIADLNNYLIVEVVAEVASTESEFPELQAAWDSIIKGNIDQAVNQYADLINRDQHLDEVIRDLQAALGKYPMDSSLYQSLGDAYMHANMLQEALDAYNRAEDLFK